MCQDGEQAPCQLPGQQHAARASTALFCKRPWAPRAQCKGQDMWRGAGQGGDTLPAGGKGGAESQLPWPGHTACAKGWDSGHLRSQPGSDSGLTTSLCLGFPCCSFRLLQLGALCTGLGPSWGSGPLEAEEREGQCCAHSTSSLALGVAGPWTAGAYKRESTCPSRPASARGPGRLAVGLGEGWGCTGHRAGDWGAAGSGHSRAGHGGMGTRRAPEQPRGQCMTGGL